MVFKMNIALRISILILMYNSCHAKEIPNCNFEDTADLTNAEKLANGSYLYEDNILVPHDQVGIYDYEELYNGTRVPLPPHPRGCVCKERSCLRFCCHPTKEKLRPTTRECMPFQGADTYDPYINVMLANRTVQKRHPTKGFTIYQGAPCVFNTILPKKADTWAVNENGSMVTYTVDPEIQLTDVISNKYFCFTPMEGNNGSVDLVLNLCPIPNNISVNERITYITMAVTIPFLILTLLVYSCIVELQNLHGRCFMSYLTSLTVGCSILCIVNLGSSELVLKFISSNWCQFVGYFGYFTFMCVFFWLNVISFDLWQSFRRTAPLRSGINKRFLYYSAYAWGVPLCLTAIVIGIDYSNVNPNYTPGIKYECWIDPSKWSSMMYYFGINLTIVIVDLTFFAMTMYKITAMKRDINKIMSRGGSRKNNQSEQDKHSFGLFFRLFLIMGITWIFDAAAYIEMKLHPRFNNPLYYVTDVLNALVGPLIFLFFILNRKVLGLIRKKYNNIRGVSGNSQKEEETSMNVTDDQLSGSTRRK